MRLSVSFAGVMWPVLETLSLLAPHRSQVARAILFHKAGHVCLGNSNHWAVSCGKRLSHPAADLLSSGTALWETAWTAVQDDTRYVSRTVCARPSTAM